MIWPTYKKEGHEKVMVYDENETHREHTIRAEEYPSKATDTDNVKENSSKELWMERASSPPPLSQRMFRPSLEPT